MMEGDALQYEYERIGSNGGGQAGNVTFTVASFNQSMVTLDWVNGTSSGKEGTVNIGYDGGIPVYAGLLTALLYLPPECLAECSRGELDWITHLEFGEPLSTVANETSQTQEFTVVAGVFQTVNLTLSLVGTDYGTLTLIYDLKSGVLVYESWYPTYEGDIYVQELTTTIYPFNANHTSFDILLPIATLILPIATAIDGVRKTLRKSKRRKRGTINEKLTLRNNTKEKSFWISLAGALLILASVFLPWSQLVNSQLYLPSSLFTLLTGSTLLSVSTSAFVITSTLAHAAAILAWLGIVVGIYAKKKLAAVLLEIGSAFIAFSSTAILVNAGWALASGSTIILVGGVSLLASAFFHGRKWYVTRQKNLQAELTSSP
jgi:hypothetical protein